MSSRTTPSVSPDASSSHYTLRQAQQRLGLSTYRFSALMHRLGIAPVVSSDGRQRSYAKSQIDALVAQLASL